MTTPTCVHSRVRRKKCSNFDSKNSSDASFQATGMIFMSNESSECILSIREVSCDSDNRFKSYRLLKIEQNVKKIVDFDS